ncbi:MAG: hypothetical protein ACI9W2_003429 [Gammaproteobacteria bacterium]|jgi:hypothetical protein
MRTVPKQLVTIGPDRTLSSFSVSQRWDGSLRVRPSTRNAVSSRGRYVLVLDPSVAFRRRCELPSNAQAAKRIMRQLADDLFPFESATTRYAFGERAGATYVFALAGAEFEELVESLTRPPGAFLCASAEPESLERALSLWSGYGSVCDFQGGPRPLARAVGISALLVAGIIAIGVLGGQHLYSKHGAALTRVRAEQAEIRRQASELATQLGVIEHMSAAQRALSTLTNQSIGAAGEQLTQRGGHCLYRL